MDQSNLFHFQVGYYYIQFYTFDVELDANCTKDYVTVETVDEVPVELAR